ncbi:MAG: hypothetical protein QHI38_02380 [Armatimonadota bacterium]|nr:hypothetical protein [Armatimonadota bacterium]
MKKFLIAFFAVLTAVAITGCGGGGGVSPLTPPVTPPVTPPTTEPGYLTGSVVSSATGQGVRGVVIRLGTLSATTDSKGAFKLYIGGTEDLPVYFQVDTSAAGAAFPTTTLVTYRSQTYYPDWVDMPIEVLNGTTGDLGTITVTEVTDPNNPPPVPYPSKDTVIIGRVVKASDKKGVSNVRVEFGTVKIYTTKTGAKGYFAVNLGRDAAVLPLFSGGPWPPTFKINTTNAGLSSTLQVQFRGSVVNQDSIPVPDEVLTGQTTALGTITVLDTGGGGGTSPVEPPPPPSF